MDSTNSASRAETFNAGGRGLQHQGLRRSNERAVLAAIGFNPGLSNADIARLCGLAPQTVSAILLDLERAGLILRGAVLRGRRGQPATPIFTRAEGAYSIGVAIGWRHVDVLLLDLQARMRAHRRLDLAHGDGERVVAGIAAAAEDLRAGLGEPQRLRDIGVALPANMEWEGVDLVGEIARRTGLEASVFNDGNAACWAEFIAFSPPRPAGFIGFFMTDHIAAGIVGEGRLWKGTEGAPPNPGAMLIEDGAGGALRPIHALASLAALDRRLLAEGIAPVAGGERIWQLPGPLLEAWLADSARGLARMVFNSAAMMQTGLVVVGGALPAPMLERLIEGLEGELARMPGAGSRPTIAKAQMGALAPAMGAAELALYHRHFLPAAEAGSG